MTLTLAILGSLLAVIPPLSADQRNTFEHVKDRDAEVDDGFYALLENASLWLHDEQPAGAGLNIPAMLATPAEYRGLPFIIEGEYLGLDEVHKVKRSGPWDGKLEQWGIRIPEADAAVMVFLVNPPPVPVVGQKVRLAGRFYKVWPVTDENTGLKLEYLVFVGHSATVSTGRALPPLTDADRRGLTAIADFTEDIDRGPFYQLINNAMLSATEAAKALPMPEAPLITHPDPIIGSPVEYRGLPLRIEGTLARRQPFKAARSGAWKVIEQWVVQITPMTRERPGESVIVYLADPPEGPQAGDKVTVVGRFYKIWRTYNEVNAPFNFVVLVGHRAQPIDQFTQTLASGSGGGGGSLSGGAAIRMAAVAVLVLGVSFYLVRRRLKMMGATDPGGASLRAMLEKRREQRASEAMGQYSDDESASEPAGPPLPVDPAEALLEMERRRVTEN